ncbi:MAG: hypothetical protein NVSMB27_22840 [Ktedonobacteraceae bacterium]
MDITPGKEVVAPKQSTSPGEGFKHMFEGIHFKFPTYKHNHPPVINVNEVADERLTVGQIVADKVALGMGSWWFIIIQSCILAIWIVINTIQLFFKPFDPYPYILLNLTLSFQAAFAAPFIMISQNRQAEKDRLTAQNDYQTDCKGEEEIRVLMEHLDHQDTVMLQIMQRLEAQEERILHRLAQIDPETARRLVGDMQQISEELSEGDTNVGGNS